MLDIYKYEQPILYNILNNSIINNKLSHAYLFDSNGNSDVYDIVLSFTKMIITSNITNETEKNNICMRIDDENYVDVKVIEPDGMWIKKINFWIYKVNLVKNLLRVVKRFILLSLRTK